LTHTEALSGLAESSSLVDQANVSYPIVDSGQELFYGNEGEIPAPAPDEAFYGQEHRLGAARV
jgi:hypothetical protein